MTDRFPFLDLSYHNDPRELQVLLCGQLFLDARQRIRHFCAEIYKTPNWHEGLCKNTLAAVRRRVVSTLETCKQILSEHEKTYLQAMALREARFAKAVQQQSFLQDFTSRQTYVGSNVVPPYSSHLGWRDDQFAKPMSLSRDSGRVILVAGAQGSGKTVLSTVIGEVSQQAEPPMTSPEIVPTSFLFFHIEEQDRLPQLLDGLKKNPNRPTWTCSWRAWGRFTESDGPRWPSSRWRRPFWA